MQPDNTKHSGNAHDGNKVKNRLSRTFFGSPSKTSKEKLLVTMIFGAMMVILLVVSSKPFAVDVIAPVKEMRSSGKTQGQPNDTKPCKPCKPCLPAVAFRRRIAATLLNIQREIHRLAGKKEVIDARWSLQLAAIAEELDPRITLTANSSWDLSAIVPGVDPSNEVKEIDRHVCPEIYTAKKPNDPYGQRAFEPQNCTNVPQFNSVLTALLPAMLWTFDTVNFVVRQIRNYYDIEILALVSSASMINKNVSGLTIKEVTEESYDEGKIMNELIDQIKTPFVFFATALTHFNNQSSLERLVRVLDQLQHVKVAGGAARDLSGHWTHGCLQQRMANYEAHYTMGYYYSKYECMFCDDLLMPFITSTAFLREIPFTTGLTSSNALYRDWFANVLVNGHLSVVCPDVMFYVSNHPNMSREQWHEIAKKWSLEKITSYEDTQHSFTCSSIGITCKNPLDTIKSFLLPPCCRAMMEKYIDYLTGYGKEHKLAHEFQSGSAIGAMKMDGYLPWDFDMDIAFHCKDYDKWMKSKQYLKSKNCKLNVMRKNKYITANCPNFFLELYCHSYNSTSQQYLPLEYQNVPTTIKYSGRDVIVSANPGLHCRSRLGLEDLKHAAHWRTLQVSNVGKAKGGYEHPGIWNACTNPKHHSCLDHYPGDGNLPFKRPFLNL